MLSMTNLLERMMAGRQISELHFEHCRNNAIKLQLNRYQLATLRDIRGGHLEGCRGERPLDFSAIESAKNS